MKTIFLIGLFFLMQNLVYSADEHGIVKERIVKLLVSHLGKKMDTRFNNYCVVSKIEPNADGSWFIHGETYSAEVQSCILGKEHIDKSLLYFNSALNCFCCPGRNGGIVKVALIIILNAGIEVDENGVFSWSLFFSFENQAFGKCRIIKKGKDYLIEDIRGSVSF